MSQIIKIFCVDSHIDSLNQLESILEDYTTEGFEKGSECLEKVKSSPPDIILMDMMLKDMSGLDVCKQIRDSHHSKHIPVIFLSQNYSLEARLECYAAGGDDYIVKPFDHDELRAKARATLKRKKQFDEAQNVIKEAANVSNELTDTLGELGAVVYFLQSIVSVKSYEALAKKIIEAHESLGLQIAIEMIVNAEKKHFNSDNIENPLEESAFEYVRDKGRLHDFGEHTVVNFPTVSIIVRNMPVNNSELHGRIRDHIAIIAQGAHSKIEALETDLGLQNQYISMVESLTQIEHALIDIDLKVRNLNIENNHDSVAEINQKLNTAIAEVNELVAASGIDELIEAESNEEEVEAVMFF